MSVENKIRACAGIFVLLSVVLTLNFSMIRVVESRGAPFDVEDPVGRGAYLLLLLNF